MKPAIETTTTGHVSSFGQVRGTAVQRPSIEKDVRSGRLLLVHRTAKPEESYEEKREPTSPQRD